MKSAIQAVLSSDTKDLLDLEYVESLVYMFGLFRDNRYIYGKQYNFWMNHKEEDGGMYQIPRQIAQFVIYLHDKEIKSYLEVGAFYGYTFAFVTAYLSKFGLERATAFDSNHYIEDFQYIRDCFPFGNMINYVSGAGPIERSGHDSMAYLFKDMKYKYDLVFIDGNHSYSAVKADWENIGKYARFCAFHDIDDMYIEDECEGGGPVRFWKELKEEQINISKGVGFGVTTGEKIYLLPDCRKIKEFTYHPENKRIMGIGVIQPGGQE